jgi:hypothetical protein
MQSAERRQRDDLPLVSAPGGHGGLLAEPLVRACAVVVADVLGDDALKGRRNRSRNFLASGVSRSTPRICTVVVSGVFTAPGHTRLTPIP